MRWPFRVRLGASLLVLAALPVARSAAAHAQAPSRSVFGIVAGPVLPLGEFGRIAATGLRGSLWYESASSNGGPVGRIEASLDHFTADRPTPASGQASVNIISGTVNVVARGRRGPVRAGHLQAYFIGGLGFYNTRTSVGGLFGGVATTKSESRGRVGVNGGGGLDLPLGGLSLFAEARLHALLAGSGYGSRNTAYVPVVLGLRF
jgi:hypothetical protein